jgi:two-component system cell cycle sensor histidine kinase/response regulator CckA
VQADGARLVRLERMPPEAVTPWLYVLPFAASVAITCFLAVVVWRRRERIPPARDFTFWLMAQAGWAAAYVIELRAPDVASKLFWDDVQWLFSAPLLACGMTFILRSVDTKPSVVRWARLAALVTIGVGAIAIVAASALGSLRASARIEYWGDVPALLYDFTTLDLAVSAALYLWMVVPAIRLAQAFVAHASSHRRRTGILFVGMFLPYVVSFLAFTDIRVFGQRDPSPIGFSLGALLIYWGILRHGLFDIVPIARAAVLDAIPDAVFVVDVLDRVVDANPKARELVERAELVGAPAAEVVPGFSGLDVYGQRPAPSRVVHAGRTLVATVLPLADDVGRRRGTALVLRDVTELEKSNEVLETRVAERTRELSQATRHLADSEAKLRAVFDGVHTLIGLLDMDGNVLAANRTALELAGGEERVIGRPFADTPFWTHDGGERDKLLGALRDGRLGNTTRFETTHPGSGGELRVIDFVLTPFRDRTGRVTWLIPEGTDITDLRRSEAERSELRRRLEHAERLEALGRVASGVAHDFNNLLSVITGSAELLSLDLEPSDPRSALVADLRTAAASASRLTKPLLAFARKQGGGVATFEVDAQLEALAPMLRRLAGGTIELGVHLGARTSRVRMDVGEFDQIVINLVVNAQQALVNRGRIEIRTTLEDQRDPPPECVGSAAPPARYIVTTVSDDGPGIPDGLRAQVFEPFFTTKSGGSGLGLASVYALAVRAGGQICLRSSAGRGTAISVHLPLADAAGRSVPVAIEKPQRHLRVLLVDDDLEVRRTARRLLERLGCSVVQAENADAGLALLAAQQSFDVLFTDVSMPERSGTEVAAEALRSRPELKVVVMSGKAPSEEVERWVSENRAHFVQKPFSLDSFEQALARVFTGS